MNELKVTEYKEQRVLTTQQLAESYGTDGKSISYNFNSNKERYQEGKHYILLQGSELKAFREIHDLPSNISKFYLWTEKGAFLHAKSLNTHVAWEVYDRLVDEYFKKEKPLSELEILQRSLQLLNNQDIRITKLENNMTIDHGQAQDLRQAGAKRILEICGGKESNAYKGLGRKLFSELWHDFKEYFHINSYSNTLISRFDEALNYVEQWTPNNNALIQIRNCNSQINLAV